MKLSAHSKNKFLETLAQYEIPKEYADPIFNYLVHGYHPGGFWNSVFANDFMGAMARSHPANSVAALKKVVSWMMNHLVNGTTHGSYQAVDKWLEQTPDVRRATLEAIGLVYSEQTEIVLILKDVSTYEPQLW
jgi:hypothetical protein